MVFSVALPRKIQIRQRANGFVCFFSPLPTEEISIRGMGEVKNIYEAIRGKTAKDRARYIQFSVPKIRKKRDAITTFETTPQP